MKFFNLKNLKFKEFKVFKFIFLIILIFAIFNILKPVYAQKWYDTGFVYRVPITIYEVSGQNLTDYQVLITVNTTS